jgi:hypothetical protein
VEGGRFFTGYFDRRIFENIGHNPPQEDPMRLSQQSWASANARQINFCLWHASSKCSPSMTRVPHMSAFGGKADIFVILSAISLRQRRPSRRRIAEPNLRGCSCVGRHARIAFGQALARVDGLHTLQLEEIRRR